MEKNKRKRESERANVQTENGRHRDDENRTSVFISPFLVLCIQIKTKRCEKRRITINKLIHGNRNPQKTRRDVFDSGVAVGARSNLFSSI